MPLRELVPTREAAVRPGVCPCRELQQDAASSRLVACGDGQRALAGRRRQLSPHLEMPGASLLSYKL